MKKKTFLIILLVTVVCCSIFSATKVDPVKSSKKFIFEVEKITGKLDDDGKAIARFSFNCSFVKCGYSWVGDLEIDKASKLMTKAEYANTVATAAEMTTNSGARVAIKAGKAGEKVLKALANSSEKALKAGKKWLNESSSEYDEKHGKK